MNKINLLITTANGSLLDSKELIERAVKRAEEYAFSRLKIDWEIDLVVTNKIPMIIPENGAGGYTFSADYIRIIIEEKTATEDIVTESVVHELCHAARWGKNNEWTKSLFDGLIFEGIAVCFEAQFSENLKSRQLFIETILERTDDKNEEILESLRDQLDSDSYDYDKIFFNGDERLPRWAGYSLGYYLVKRYLKKTGKKIEDAFADRYADFRIVL